MISTTFAQKVENAFHQNENNNDTTSWNTPESFYKSTIGVRAGGARGAAAPPNFGQLRFFWAARENLGKASF